MGNLTSRRLGAWALGIGALATLAAWGPATVPAGAKTPLGMTLAPDTTWFINPPLRDDGTIDYVKAYDASISKGVTPENNAYAPMLKIFGPDTVSDKIRDATLAVLGIKDLPAGGDYFQGFTAYLQSVGKSDPNSALDDQILAATGTPWKPQAHPELAGWLTREEAHLDALVAATERERFYIPAISSDQTMIGVMLPSLGAMRDAARALSLRSSLRAGEGNIDAAWADALAVHRLARLLQQNGFLIQQLVGVAIEVRGVQGDRAILGSPALTSAKAKACLADLQKLAPMGTMAQCMGTERLGILDAANWIAAGKAGTLTKAQGDVSQTKTAAALALTPEQRAQVDWDAVLRQINGHCDRIVAAAQFPTFAQRKEAGMQLDKDIEALKAKSTELMNSPPTERIGGMLCAIFLPSLGKADTLYDRARALVEMDQVGFALAAYHADKGSWPETLEALAPGYIKTIPSDRFTDKPLIYKPSGSGFLLYSVNDYLEDNGGNETRDAKGHYDLVVKAGG